MECQNKWIFLFACKASLTVSASRKEIFNDKLLDL